MLPNEAAHRLSILAANLIFMSKAGVSAVPGSRVLSRYDLVCPVVFIPLDKRSVRRGGNTCARANIRPFRWSVWGPLREPNSKYTLTRRAARILAERKPDTSGNILEITRQGNFKNIG